MKGLGLTCLIFFALTGFGQNYSIESISDELKNEANAVVRKDNTKFKILSIDKAEFHTEYAITILNEKAKRLGDFVEFYDKLSSLDAIEIAIYDKNGTRIRKIKSSEISDISAVSSGTLFDDSRVKYVEIEEKNYPYTVEYSVTKKYKFLYSIPDKYFYPGQHISVESSEHTLEYPVEVGARYREQLFTGT